jgi:hypothetical protein
VLVVTDEQEAPPAQIVLRKPSQQINQDDLIEHVVFKPEDDVVVLTVALEIVILLTQKLGSFVVWHPVKIPRMFGADSAPLCFPKPGRSRSLAQGIRPPDHLSGQAGLFQGGKNIVAASNM